MAYTTINKSTEHFNTKLYEGNGSSPRSITGVGFQPDWTWTKNRDNTNGHGLFDAVRGYATGKGLSTHNTNAQGSADTYGYLSSRDSDGYTMTQGGSSMTMNNTNGESYVSWNWKANGAGSANTDGTTNSTVSANTTAGFSIVKYTGNSGGSGYSATIGHGLGVAPKFIFVKCISHSAEWNIYSGDATDFLILNETNATSDDNTRWYDTAPTNSVFTVGTNTNTNNVGRDYIAYCFAPKTGYSKMGSYIGNGNADGTFVYTGFKPAWVMYKKRTGSNNVGRWSIRDNKRDPFNVATKGLEANGSSAENTGSQYWDLDMLSNGFKLRTTEHETNGSGDTFIYMAFGQSLVGSNNVPCTAR